MAIEICRIGGTEWPRYILIHQSPEGSKYWAGNAWNADMTNACLYAFLPDACREFERLQKHEVGNRCPQEFEAKITVKLHSDRTLTEQELAQFLNRFAELFLPTDGPTNNSMIQAEIHWHELRERVRDEFSNLPKKDSTE